MENDINLNNTECIVTHDKIGVTTYYNICKDTTTSVNWGVLDYMCFIFLIVIISVVITCLITFIKDLFE
nr:MAG TPA: hypothetical protein [Caudoviricetes sp.]